MATALQATGRAARDRLAHCWAHARRRSLEAQAAYPEAQHALDLIGKLYAVEHAVRDARAGDVLAARQREPRPRIESLRAWLVSTKALPQSLLGKAIAYTDGCWPGLVRFLDDACIPLDNHAAERSMRSVVVERTLPHDLPTA